MTDTPDWGRLPPHDIDAERCVLGAAMLSRDAATRACAELSIEHFYRPAHKAIFRVILALHHRDQPIDAYVVRTELQRTDQLAALGNDPGGYLADLLHDVPTATNAARYIADVRELGTKRFAIEEMTRLAQAAYDRSTTADEVIGMLDAVTDTLRGIATDEAITGLSTLGAFVDETDAPHDWLIPGVLERMDRVIVVASEGAGKTTLARQVTVMLAAGLHPFAPTTHITPVRTLYVDLENPPALVRRKARQLVHLGRSIPGWDDDRCWRWTRPGGIDLRKPHDQHLLDKVIAESKAEFVALGPLYKAFSEGGGEKAETVNGEVARVLDRVRERHGVALWLETHAPMEQHGHRALRPLGSGVWSRWPEFGLALRRSGQHPGRVNVERFRGDRDERAWPHHLDRASPWPWQAVWDGGFAVEEAVGA